MSFGKGNWFPQRPRPKYKKVSIHAESPVSSFYCLCYMINKSSCNTVKLPGNEVIGKNLRRYHLKKTIYFNDIFILRI